MTKGIEDIKMESNGDGMIMGTSVIIIGDRGNKKCRWMRIGEDEGGWGRYQWGWEIDMMKVCGWWRMKIIISIIPIGKYNEMMMMDGWMMMDWEGECEYG
jgi:hypothetical protein